MNFVKPVLFFSLFGFLFLAGCQKELVSKKEQKSAVRQPRLVLTIVVDQMLPDHFTRYSHLYEGGLARLLNQGAVFSDAHHDHGHTVTGAGHATIASGCYPSVNGIVGNNWYNRDLQEAIYCCEDREAPLLGYPDENIREGRSPRNLLVSTLGDWLKAASAESKVFGVARKDRASIFSTGKNADGAYWYNSKDGKLITSEYYTDRYPEWVERFNESGMVDQYFESGWHKVLAAEAIYELAREDEFPAEGEGHSTFPHLLNKKSESPDKAYYSALEVTPFGEELVLEFAKEAVRHEQLGMDEIPDILFVGFSAADAIGHRYGPFSQEALDYYIRLDRYLGDFFDFLDTEIGKDRYIVMLSSDHGVLPLPEDLIRQGIPAKRISDKERWMILRQIQEDVAAEFNLEKKLILSQEAAGIYLNYAAADKQGVSREAFEEKMTKRILEIESIENVFSKEDLMQKQDGGSTFLGKYQRSFHPERSGDLMIQGKKYHLVKTAYGTSHGSPYEYDTHIPLIFLGPGIKPATHTGKVRTVDIAPTIAEFLGLKPHKKIDGESLLPLLINP